MNIPTKDNMSMRKAIEEKARKHFDERGAHDFSHTLRVLKVAEKIARAENNVDYQILKAACLLHDIGRKKEEKGRCSCHAECGSKMAVKILKEVDFPKDKIEDVAYAISVHRKSKNIKAKTIEAKILQDADRIDLFGAIGISRTIIRHSKNSDAIIHSKRAKKLKSHKDYDTESIFEVIKVRLKIKASSFNTKKGRDILRQRKDFLRMFVKEFEHEWVEP